MLFLISTLKQGDNPYKILGITKDASFDEIKKAYRTLSYKYHPDISHDKSTESLFIRVNDAFEVLSDPDRKARYDRFGTLTEVVNSEPDATFEPQNFKYFNHDEAEPISCNTPLLTKLNFEQFMEVHEEAIIFTYSNIGCTYCLEFLKLFEDFSNLYSKIIPCGRIDVEPGAGLAHELGINSMPSFSFVKNENGQIHVQNANTPITSVNELAKFIAKQWKLNIEEINDINNYISMQNRPTIIQVTKSNHPTMHFMKIMSQLSSSVKIGHIQDSNIALSMRYKAHSYPFVLVFRDKNEAPKVVTKLRAISDLGILTPKCFPYLENQNLCQGGCFVLVGKPSEQIISILNNENATFAWIDLESASKFRASEDDILHIFDKKFSNLNQHIIHQGIAEELKESIKGVFYSSIPNFSSKVLEIVRAFFPYIFALAASVLIGRLMFRKSPQQFEQEKIEKRRELYYK